eukprot:m.179799 g.179799  ORF g.179799 m.179799 type:complete len:63 (+) comp15481_c0_seq9:102-290(+)
MTRPTNYAIKRPRVCKEGATPWQKLKTTPISSSRVNTNDSNGKDGKESAARQDNANHNLTYM